jgi:hypothetical protein
MGVIRRKKELEKIRLQWERKEKDGGTVIRQSNNLPKITITKDYE